MSTPTHRLALPLDRLPTVVVAGQFWLNDRGYSTRYFTTTHALHLHGYPGSMRLGGQRFDLAAGDVTLTPRRTASWYDLPEPGQHLCVHFHLPRAVRAGRITKAPAFCEVPLHTALAGDAAYAGELFQHLIMHHAAAETHPTHASSAAAVLCELLLWLARCGEADRSPRASLSHHAVARAAGLIEQHLHEPMTVPALAERVGLSQNYLAARFRERYGMTIPRYLLRRRIDQARQLLRCSDLPIKAIGARVGLPDPQHFNKQFRRLTGQSPSAFRARLGSRSGDR